jgi:hypothetical protein
MPDNLLIRKAILILSSLIFLFKMGNAQKFALLDTKFKQPILYTDSITVEQLSQNYFPVSMNDFDTLNANFLYIQKMLSTPQRSKMQYFELRTEGTKIAIERIPMSYADRYNITLMSSQKDINAVYRISEGVNPNKKGLEKINRMLSYISSNQSFFTKPYVITPKIYSVVVVHE